MPKNRAESGTLAIRVSEKLLELLKPEDLNLDEIKKVGGKQAFLKLDLIIIILLRK